MGAPGANPPKLADLDTPVISHTITNLVYFHYKFFFIHQFNMCLRWLYKKKIFGKIYLYMFFLS